MADAPAQWYPDPLGRHEFRYWDGADWTAHVADEGETSTDPIDESSHEGQDGHDGHVGHDGHDADNGHDGDGGSAVAVSAVDHPEEPQDEQAPPSGLVDPYAVSVVHEEPRPVTVTATPTERGPLTNSWDSQSAGISGALIDGSYAETDTGEHVRLQNAKMLKIELGEHVLARQGSMVAFQGHVDFEFEGAGGVGKFLKKALTGEGVPLMRCKGQGELFLAHDADEVHLLWLDGGGITVNGKNILAFDATLEWDIQRISGAGAFAGGLFNTVLRGTGWVAITTHGTPVVLNTDAPTFADTDAAVAWSSNLQTRLNRTFKVGALVGRGSGELAQLAFSGSGFVIVQASEGPAVPQHSHGS